MFEYFNLIFDTLFGHKKNVNCGTRGVLVLVLEISTLYLK